MRRFVGLLLLVSPAVLTAQSHRVSLLSGFGIEDGEPDFRLGYQVGGRITAFATSRVALRLDLYYATIGRTFRESPPCQTPCPAGTGDRIKALGASSHVAFLRHNGFAWTIGGGVLHLIASSQGGSYTRPAWTLGFTTSMNRRLYFDWHYHGMIGRRMGTRGFTLLSLGIGL